MIRATTGVWLNYATTLVFQVLFASRFGSGASASAFVVVYGVAIALSGFVITGIRSVLQPRLLSPDGEMVSQPLKIMAALILVSTAICAALALAASSVATVVTPSADFPRHVLEDLVRVTAAFTLTQILAGVLSTVSLAHGGRFVPAAVLAIPTTAAGLYIALVPDAGIQGMYLSMLAASGLQIVTLLFAIEWPVRIVAGSTSKAGTMTVATVAVSALLSIILPIERVVASTDSPAGGAQYFYASRSLVVGQQLIVGGALLSILSTWSLVFAGGQVERMRRSVWATAAVGTALLAFASALALVAGEQIVSLVYEHGSFTSEDTRVVTDLLLISLVGFCAEGVGLILSQGLLAARRNRATILIGLGNLTLRVALIFALGSVWGAYGVAAAYSASSLIVLAGQAGATWREVGHSREPRSGYRAAAFVALATVGVAAALRATGTFDGFPGAAIVCACFAAICLARRTPLAGLFRAAREA